MPRLIRTIYFIIIIALPFKLLYATSFSDWNPSTLSYITLICASLLFAYYFVKKSLHKRDFRLFDKEQQKIFISFMFLLGFFFVFETVSTLHNSSDTLFNTLRPRMMATLYVILPIFILSRKNYWERAIECFTLATIVQCVAVILVGMGIVSLGVGRSSVIQGTYVGTELFLYRASGLLSGYGDTASLFSIVLPYAIYVLWTRKKYSITKKIFLCILIIIILYASFPLQSRNVWLSMLLVVSAYIFLTFVKRINLLKITAFFITLAVIALLLPVICDLVINMTDKFVGIRVSSVNLRFDMYKTGIELIAKHPILGIGHRAFLYYSQGKTMHNAFLSAFLSAGLGGLAIPILYIAIFANLFKHHSTNFISRIALSSFVGIASSHLYSPSITSGSSVCWSILGFMMSVCIWQRRWLLEK